MKAVAVEFVAAAAAFLFWTFVEYVYHRRAHSLQEQSHLKHHTGEGDPRRRYVPVVLITLVAFITLLPAGAIRGVVIGTALEIYLFIELHELCHNPTLAEWSLTRHHDLHHARPSGNFGVTSSLWDRAFGTRHQPQKSRKAVAA